VLTSEGKGRFHCHRQLQE